MDVPLLSANGPAGNDATRPAARQRDLGWLMLALLALLLTILVAFSNWERVSSTYREAMRLRGSLGRLRQVSLALEDAETGQRGYLLTHRPIYLEPYTRAADRLEKQLANLDTNWMLPNDRPQLTEFESAVRTKMAELKETIDAQNSKGTSAALAIVNTDRGQQSMDRARELAASLERDVSALTAAKSAAVTDVARDAGLISVGASLTLFLLLATANIRLRKEREMANAANRAKSEFLASMSHELRTPLNAIIGYSEMLAEEAEDTGQVPFVADLSKIQAAGRHLLMLINSVLDLSKIEAGRMDLYLETTSVHALVNEVVAVVQPLAEKNRNVLEVRVADHVGSMHTDQTKVRQTLYNLLSNACKFTENGKVTLDVRRESVENEDRVLFTVVDTGVGMSQEEIKRVFEPFAQADTSTSRRFGGTGLGLTLSRRFAQMMGGDISVESQPKKGSKFTLSLPGNLAGPVATADPARAATGSGSYGDVVLVIDDEPAVHDLLRRTLTKHGFEVEDARNGEEGLRLARKVRPVAITLDVMMPGMDGWSVLSALKSDPQLCEIPVLMLTIVDSENMGYTLGASDYLTKPIDRERLLSVLARYRSSGTTFALVVEDDESSRSMMRRALEGEGWKVEDASNGRVALECIDQRKPGIILLDLMMPEMDGFEFLEQLRSRPHGKNIPVVVVTARDLTPEDRSRLNGHVSRVLMKGSFQVHDLLAEVSQLVTTRIRAKQPPQSSTSVGS